MNNREIYAHALAEVLNNNWNEAHHIIQKMGTPEAAWIHAYLHRVEGDLGNAAYWYRRAGRAECFDSLEQEHQALVKALT